MGEMINEILIEELIGGYVDFLIVHPYISLILGIIGLIINFWIIDYFMRGIRNEQESTH